MDTTVKSGWLTQLSKVSVCITSGVHMGLLFSISLPTFVVCLSDYTHLNRCEMISHCGFTGIFLIINLHSHVQISIICNSKDVETCKQPRYQWKSESCSVESDSLWPHGLYSPWISPGQNTGVGSLSLLQGIFPTQGLNPIPLHCRQFFTSWATREAQEYWSGYPILLQWIFLTQESNWGLIHCRCILYHLSYQGSSKCQ